MQVVTISGVRGKGDIKPNEMLLTKLQMLRFENYAKIDWNHI